MFIKKLKVASVVTVACVTGLVGAAWISPWGATPQAVAQVARPLRIVSGEPTAVSAKLPVLPVELLSVNVGAKTVTIRESKLIPIQTVVNGARYKVQVGDKVTVALTPRTQLTRLEESVPVAEIRLGDIVSAGSSGVVRARVEDTPLRGVPATASPVYIDRRFVGRFKVVSVDPLRLQKADSGEGKAIAETLDVPKEVEMFSRSIPIELSEVAEAKAFGIPIDIETSKTPKGKLKIKKIRIAGMKAVKRVTKDAKGTQTHFQIGSKF